jgi:hypothetical protein
MWRRSSFLTLPVTLLLCAGIGAAQSSTVNVQVSNQVNSSVGVNGRLQLAMSTSLQLASWSYRFFSQTPLALPALNALQPQHTRMQLVQSFGISPRSTPSFRPSKVPATTVPNFKSQALLLS